MGSLSHLVPAMDTTWPSFLTRMGTFPSQTSTASVKEGTGDDCFGAAVLSFPRTATHSLFSQQRRHLRPSPSFLSSTRLAPLPEQHFGLLRPSISKLDSTRTNSLPVPKHHRRFPARSHGSASEQCPRHDCRTSRKELPPPRSGHLQCPALVVRGPTSCPTCASCHGLQTLSEIHRAAHIP